MVFGTFDIIHPGHLDFFRQARALSKNPWLIVSVSRDVNAERIKHRKLFLKEALRLRQVQNLSEVDQAVLGGVNQYFSHIRRQKPDIIALGYDQKAYVVELKRDLKKAQMKTRVVRLKACKPRFYKTSLIKRNMIKYKQLSKK
jgi:FAD synthetase